MYKSFYSLAQAPFSKDIRPSDAFPSTDYQGALNALNYLQKSKGMGLLIGDPGAGKTFTLRSFKESLNPSLYHVVYFPLSTGGVMDFYRGLVYGLGRNRSSVKSISLGKFNKALSEWQGNVRSHLFSF